MTGRDAPRGPAPQPVALVSGFGPFGRAAYNPSEHVARRLDGRVIRGARVVGLVLPVTYAAAASVLARAIARLDPCCVVATGLGSGAAARLETRAANRVTSLHPDNDGVVRAGEDLEPAGPPLRASWWGELDASARAHGATSSAPTAAHRLAATLAKPTLPVCVSDDAGGYVCNATLYHLLAAARPGVPAGFLHLPDDPAPGPEGVAALADLATRLVAALTPRTAAVVTGLAGERGDRGPLVFGAT